MLCYGSTNTLLRATWLHACVPPPTHTQRLRPALLISLSFSYCSKCHYIFLYTTLCHYTKHYIILQDSTTLHNVTLQDCITPQYHNTMTTQYFIKLQYNTTPLYNTTYHPTLRNTTLQLHNTPCHYITSLLFITLQHFKSASLQHTSTLYHYITLQHYLMLHYKGVSLQQSTWLQNTIHIVCITVHLPLLHQGIPSFISHCPSLPHITNPYVTLPLYSTVRQYSTSWYKLILYT